MDAEQMKQEEEKIRQMNIYAPRVVSMWQATTVGGPFWRKKQCQKLAWQIAECEDMIKQIRAAMVKTLDKEKLSTAASALPLYAEKEAVLRQQLVKLESYDSELNLILAGGKVNYAKYGPYPQVRKEEYEIEAFLGWIDDHAVIAKIALKHVQRPTKVEETVKAHNPYWNNEDTKRWINHTVLELDFAPGYDHMLYSETWQFSCTVQTRISESSDISSSGREGILEEFFKSGVCAEGTTMEDVKWLYGVIRGYHLNDMVAHCIHMEEELKSLPSDYDSRKAVICGEYGYLYGHSWLYKPIKRNTMRDLKALLGISGTPKWTPSTTPIYISTNTVDFFIRVHELKMKMTYEGNGYYTAILKKDDKKVEINYRQGSLVQGDPDIGAIVWCVLRDMQIFEECEEDFDNYCRDFGYSMGMAVEWRKLKKIKKELIDMLGRDAYDEFIKLQES